MRMSVIFIAIVSMACGSVARAEELSPRQVIEMFHIGNRNHIETKVIGLAEQWSNILNSDLSDDLTNRLPQDVTLLGGEYLQSVKVANLYQDTGMSAAERSKELKQPNVLQLIESTPTLIGERIDWYGYISVGQLDADAGQYKAVYTYKLNDVMTSAALKNAVGTLKLITSYALIQDAIQTKRPRRIVCALAGIGGNYLHDLSQENTDQPLDEMTDSEKDIYKKLSPAMRGISCPVLK